jgi:PAS domain S-box-containing protein
MFRDKPLAAAGGSAIFFARPPTERVDHPLDAATSPRQLIQLQRAAMESAANAIMITDARGVILWTNPAFTALAGYSAGELVGQTPRVLKSGNYDRNFYEAMWATLRAGQTWHGEIVNRRKDGSLYVGEQTITPVRTHGQATTHFVAVFSEIAERKFATDVLHSAAVSQAGRARRRIGFELALIALGAGLVGLGGNIFGWFEAIFTELVRQGAHPWFDEVFGAICFVLVGMLVFSLRRWREARAENVLQQNLVGALGTLHTELEDRIARRTRELARTNEALVREIAERKNAEEALRGSEERYRALVDAAPTGIFVDVGNRFAYANQAMCRILGADSPDCFVGRDVFERLHPESHAVIRARMAAGMAGQSVPLMDQRFLRLDGSTVDVETTATPIVFHGQPAIQVVVNDITRRKEAEAALHESKALYHSLVEQAPAGIFRKDAEGRYVYVNACFTALTGLSREECLGHTAGEIAREFTALAAAQVEPKHDITTLEHGHSHHLGIMATGSPVDLEQVWRSPDGRWRHVRIVKSPVFDATGSIVGSQGIMLDITGQKETERELREQREQWSALVNMSPNAVFVLQDEKFAFVNPAAAAMLALPAEALIGRGAFDFAPAGLQASLRARLEQAGEQPVALPLIESRLRRADGTLIEVESASVHFQFNQRPAVLLEAREITARKRAEMRIRLQHAVTQVLAEATSLEQAQRGLLEAVGQGIDAAVGELWSIDRSAKILRCGESWRRPGPELDAFVDMARRLTLPPTASLPGRVCTAGNAVCVAPLADALEFPRAAETAAAKLHAWVGFPVKVRDEVVAVAGFFSATPPDADPMMLSLLTSFGRQLGQFAERQQLAEQFRQAQKMEAIGTLAGGIAHDFNNIIAGINGYADLAKMTLNGGNAEVQEYLDAVLAGGGRAAALVRQILAFSRQQEHERRPVQLRHVVGEALKLLRATIPATIDFDFSFDRDLPTAMADATHVHQIVMNLCTNAWHAMGDRPGRLGVKLERCAVDAELAALHPGLRPGSHVRLSVSDTGHGMDQATLERIFEPFFTTKAPGEGTGLGLSVVHGIMQSHEGAVTVQSQPGEGTVFRLYFPACAEASSEKAVEPANLPLGRGQRVLYVDDEAPLALIAGRVLERLGYAAATYTSPLAALEAVRAEPTRYDLVITDLAMPAMAGLELAQQMLAIRADLPVVLMTGYTASLTPARVQALGLRDLLSKPISVPALATMAARVLAAKN